MKPVTADSNILISAILRGGKPGDLLNLARSGKIEIALSEDILAETLRVLSTKFHRSGEQLQEDEAYLRRIARMSTRLVTNHRNRHISANEDQVMESVGDEKPWTIDRERRPCGLRLVLPKRSYVLPWAQFLYAEGAADSVRAVFNMHDVVVTG